ncbi:MAG: ATP-dependent helicase [Roseburia sp.]|nr:ATP-dependent helicase [Roseburia sp.]
MERNYNKSQLQAITHGVGPCLTLAGPGSGKTAVITERVKYLITEQHIKPSNILVITFTKAAATEMKERFYKLMSDATGSTAGFGQYPVTFGTFHAVFFQILKHAYNYNANNIIKDEQKYSCMRDLVLKQRLEYEDEAEFVNAVLGEISMVKNTGVDLTHYYSTNCATEMFRRLYSQYHEYLYTHKLIDFDDMLVYTYELFKERTDILGAWQRKYQYILIDEFQDINKIQYDIVKMLAAPEHNLFVVGDDDQSIYRFRGAKPEIMLHFFDDFPTGKRCLLDTNYRSQENIVKSSLNLIKYNKERYKKQFKASLPAAREVEYGVFNTQREQNMRIVRDIYDRVERGGKYEEFAVLFRTNTQPRVLMEQFMEYNIPFYAKDSIPNIYEHWIAKDLFAYIRIAQGSRQRSDFLQIMNRPKRYISRESLDDELVAFDVWEWFFEEQPWVAKRIQQLEHDIKMLERMNPYAAINYIRRGIGYDEFLKEYADYRRIRADDLFDVIEELHASAKEYNNFDAWFLHIEEYAEELEKIRMQKQEQREGVVLATLHSAKGLEFDHVYIVDVNEGIMPYKKATLEQEIEEERRLFYVGMTRARQDLHLFSTKQMNHKDAEISRFVGEARGGKQ